MLPTIVIYITYGVKVIMSESGKMASTVMNRIEADPSILEANKKHLRDLVTYLQAKNSKPNTVEKYVYHYEKILKAMGGMTDILKADKPDLERAVAKINTLKLVDEEKRKIKVTIKVLYKHFLGEDEYYPRQVAWIRTSSSRNKMLPQDLLSEAEVLKLIESARDIRDKAIVALLFDTGMRIGELVGLRKKDIETDSEPVHVTVGGKTGMRKIPIMFSVSYVTRYLDTLGEVKPGDSLWLAIGTWSNTGRGLDADGIRQMLKRLGKKSGLGKRIYPHLFRHSRASNYANKLTEQQLKVYFGWTGDSRMAATYVHLSGRDIDNAVMAAYGKSVPELKEPLLKEKICPKCRSPNSTDSFHCARCGSSLDIATAVREQEIKDKVKGAATSTFKPDDLRKEDVGKSIREKKRGKR